MRQSRSKAAVWLCTLLVYSEGKLGAMGVSASTAEATHEFITTVVELTDRTFFRQLQHAPLTLLFVYADWYAAPPHSPPPTLPPSPP
jgi:hypothetical protein